MDSKMYVVRGYRLANYLMDNEIKMVRIDRNKNDKSWLLFLFEDTQELRRIITKFNHDLKTSN